MSHEIVASNNLRATHDILLAMAGSKRALENILEHQNDIFALFTDGGQILKGNEALAGFFKQPSDVLFRFSLKTLFAAASWQLFANKVEVLKKHRERKDVSFELAIDSELGRSQESRDFLWTINRFDSISTRRGQVYSVIGRDMTEIRRFQKRLGMIYGSVPLGIYQIDRQKRFSGPYSAYCEIIFGRENLEGLPYAEALAMAYPNMSPSQRSGLEQLIESIGEEEFWYDIYKSHFPRELNLGTKDEALWIGFNYSPIIRDARVEEILVVAEDITERVLGRKANSSHEFASSHYAEIFGDAHESEEQVIDRAIFDIDVQLTLLNALTEANLASSAQYLEPLAAIKHSTQSAALGYISQLLQKIEDKLIAEETGGLELTQLYDILDKCRSEINDSWIKVKSVLHVVHPVLVEKSEIPADDLREKLARLQLLLESKNVGQGINIVSQLLNLMNPGVKLRSTVEIEHNLRTSFTKAAARLDKEVLLEMEIEDIAIGKEKLSKISEILTEILTYTLTEGIELVAERLAHQKKSRTQVKITLAKVDDNIAITVEDDGQGIDVKRLLEAALKKGTITEAEAQRMSNQEKFRLIFQPGLRRETTSELSSRGVGISAADAAARLISPDNKGIETESIFGRGTVFSFKCGMN